MASTEHTGYTAKFVDGPLEGKTMTVNFLESGDPQPRLEIPVGNFETTATGGKRYLYARGSGLEFAGDDPSSGRPSAVDYRYQEVLVD